MASNVSRGAYYKARTRKWLAAQGWQVADMEIVRWVFRPGGKRIPVKRDQFGADLIAMNWRWIVFVQVKSGKSAVGGTFPEARRTFAQFVFPDYVQRWVVAWAPRARAPRVVICPPELRDTSQGTRTKGSKDGQENAQGQKAGQAGEGHAAAQARGGKAAASGSTKRTVAGHGAGS